MSNHAWWQSMVARITLSMFTVIIIAELIAGAVWYSSNSQSKRESANHAISAITSAAANTTNYFASLPVNYRHLVLEQLRSVGGTRFFISMNNRQLSMPSLTDYALVPEMEALAAFELKKEWPDVRSLAVTITRRDELKLFNAGVKLDELPALWKDYSLVLGKLDLPIVVIQVEQAQGEWIYLATVLPLSFNSLTTTFMDGRQLFFLLIATVMLGAVSYYLLQKEVRPFRSLAKSATLMGAQMQVEEIQEEGSSETRAAIHAFNKMNRRIRAYLRDRDLFFSAISHDIKTPLACLKLRTEMLDDDITRQRFEKLLSEVEMMLNGALQCMKDNDIHEEQQHVDLIELLEHAAVIHNKSTKSVSINAPESLVLYGKPLALKRCVTNLINNGVKYGGNVAIEVTSNGDVIHVLIRDSGSGLAEDMLEKVFEPYFRVASDEEGSGLGLSISRSIARSHGGDVTLSNGPKGGLEVDLVLVNIR